MNHKLDRMYNDIRTRYNTICAYTSATDASQVMEYRTIDRKNLKTVMVLVSREYPTTPGRGVETFTQYMYFSPAGDTHFTVRDENGEHVLPRQFPEEGRVTVSAAEAVHALVALKTSWVPTQHSTYLNESRANGRVWPGMSQAERKKWYQGFYKQTSLRYLEDRLAAK